MYGESSRPWIVASGFPEESDLGKTLKRLGLTVKYVDPQGNLYNQLREIDYDALVVVGHVPSHPAGHLCVLQFGGVGEILGRGSGHSGWRYCSLRTGRAGRLLGPDEDIPPSAARLARESLAPTLVNTNPRNVIGRVGDHNTWLDFDGVKSFVREQDGYPCAGYWLRPSANGDTQSQWWWLPEEAERKGNWLEAALEAWNIVSSTAFPYDGTDWERQDKWLTASERTATAQLAAIESEFLNFRREFEEKIATMKSALEDARAAASNSERRLLTRQGETLKEAVAAALGELGFLVSDSDLERSAAGSPLLEDLQVRVNDWVAIVEVKGYSKSAGKTADFQKIGRAALQFERVNGSPPDARWYVINQNFQSPPDQRSEAFKGCDMDVEEFARDGGLVLDTRDLFLLVRDVAVGEIGAEEARSLLVARTGRFKR